MTIDRIRAQHASEAYDATLSTNQPQTTSGVKATQEPSGTPSPATTAPTGRSKSSAIVTLSPEAQTFARALAQAQAQPDARADRVAALRARIAQGNYEVDSTALAGKLLAIGEQ